MTPEERAAKIVHEGTSIELVAWEVSVDCDQLCAEIADAIREAEAAAEARERERCAKVADSEAVLHPFHDAAGSTARGIAAAIRASKEQQ